MASRAGGKESVGTAVAGVGVVGLASPPSRGLSQARRPSNQIHLLENHNTHHPTSTLLTHPPTSNKVCRRLRAYLLSNALPLLVGTAGWAFLEPHQEDQPHMTFHPPTHPLPPTLIRCTLLAALHLGLMVCICVLFTHRRSRETTPASWRSLKSVYGLVLADTLSLTCVVYQDHFRHLPGFCLSSLASFFSFRLLLLELAFDFVHYCAHRLCHVVPWMYTHIHKIHHHHHADLHVGSTLQMHPVDGVLTNTVPLVVAVAVVPLQSRWELHALLAYKTAQELFGHCGVHTIKVKSLPSNPWLAEWLGINLCVADHTMHHVDGRFNFGKRLSFWDRLFGTFKNGDNLH